MYSSWKTQQKLNFDDRIISLNLKLNKLLLIKQGIKYSTEWVIVSYFNIS